MSNQAIKHTTDNDFEKDVLKADKPVVVDFWAEWCGPCKMIAPVLDEMADSHKDKLQIVKLNVDDHRQTPGKYGIRGIPTLMLFKQGKLLATKVGAVNKTQLMAFVDEHIG
jgi:thioredoxin 1